MKRVEFVTGGSVNVDDVAEADLKFYFLYILIFKTLTVALSLILSRKNFVRVKLSAIVCIIFDLIQNFIMPFVGY